MHFLRVAIGLPALGLLVGMKFPRFIENIFFVRVRPPNEAEITKVLEVLSSKAAGVKCLAWDMDLTAVQKHSMGRLERKDLDVFLDMATPAFVTLVPRLHQAGMGLAIATHSDEAEYGGSVQPETHIAGEELARALVDKHFSKEVADAFYVAAYNPSARGDDGKEPDNAIKRYHMREIGAKFNCAPSEIMFFEDTPQIVADCQKIGVKAVQVNPRRGFQAKDIIDYKF